MKQTKRGSLIEASISIFIGFWIAIGSQVVIFPLFGIHIPFAQDLAIGLLFTVVSVVRSYYVRRLFEHLRVTGAIK